MSEVIIKRINSTILIKLNREKVLNALNLNMVREIFKYMAEWDNDDGISGVVIKGAGEKAFCAGGDIVSVYHSKNDITNNLSDNFFREEYILNLAISNFSKPWVSILNGIAMGGGLGLSVHGSHRIVNEKTKTAMPESAIGLFPDVGGSHFLSKMKEVGLYLALTGKVMDGQDSMFVGIGTHYINNSKLDLLEEEIINKNNYKIDFIDDLLNKNSLPVLKGVSSIEKDLEYIKKYFSKKSLIEIFNALKSSQNDWEQNILDILFNKSPTSMSVTIRQLKEAKNLSLKECLKMEFRICQAMMRKHDFYEGVRANLVDKDRKPKWKPKNILEIDDSLINEYFSELGKKELFYAE